MSIRELVTVALTGAFEPLADPEPCSCDEALALRAKLDEANAQLELRIIQHDTVEAELRRRIINQSASLEYPRLEDVVEIQRLKGELARTRFVSTLRGKVADGWGKMLDRTRTELDAQRRTAVDLFDALKNEQRAHAEAQRAAETWEELAHGQEVLGKQADALVERFKALALDATAKMAAMEVSMNAAHTERNRLVALVARICKPTAGIRRTDIDGWDPAWHGCVFIDTSQGQMSWHYHDSDAHLFADLPAYEKPWDGHTTAEKYERLWRLTELTAAIP